MFDSKLVMLTATFGGPPDTVEVYSPWFPRGGDYARCGLEIVAVSNASVALQVFTKMQSDDSDGSAVSGTLTLLAVGLDSLEVTSLEDYVRYQYTITGGEDSESNGWVLFRMIQPEWFDAVKT